MKSLASLLGSLGSGCSHPETLPLSPIPKPQQAVTPQPALLGAEDDLRDEIGPCRICCNDERELSYECKRGHAVCSSCCKKLKGKCSICRRTFDGIILRPIENEVIVRPIENDLIKRKSGVKTKLLSDQMFGCDNTCRQTECFCPFSSCDFSVSFAELQDHVRQHHAQSVTSFSLNTKFALALEPNQTHAVLQEEKLGLIFVLNHGVQNLRRVFNVDCIGPPNFNNLFVCKLSVVETEAGTFSMRTVMKSRPEVVTKWEEHAPSKNSLTVTSLSDTEEVFVHVCIRHVGPNYLF